jgi:hypothetical protein
MSEQPNAKSSEPSVRDAATQELVRLLGLVRRLEKENASLRQELTNRPAPA